MPKPAKNQRSRPAPPAQQKAHVQKKRRRKRRGRYTLHYLLLVVMMAVAGVILSLTVFFKITAVTVTGCTHYSTNEVVAASGIQLEENMFRLKDEEIEAALLAKYPYMEQVHIRRVLPSGIVLEVTEETPAAVVAVDAVNYTIISDTGKVLEANLTAPPEGIPLAKGIETEASSAGEYLPEDQQEALSMLNKLNAALAATGFGGEVDYYDLSNEFNMTMLYDGRIWIELGSESELEDKLKFIKEVIDNQLEDTFMGTMDASQRPEIWTTPMDITPLIDQDLISLQPQEEPEEEQEPAQAAGESSIAPPQEEASSVPAAEEPAASSQPEEQPEEESQPQAPQDAPEEPVEEEDDGNDEVSFDD